MFGCVPTVLLFQDKATVFSLTAPEPSQPRLPRLSVLWPNSVLSHKFVSRTRCSVSRWRGPEGHRARLSWEVVIPHWRGCSILLFNHQETKQIKKGGQMEGDDLFGCVRRRASERANTNARIASNLHESKATTGDSFLGRRCPGRSQGLGLCLAS